MKRWIGARLKRPAIALARSVLDRPRLKTVARALLDRVPALQVFMHALVRSPARVRLHHVPQSSADLSPRAALAYRELRDALEAQNR